MANLVWQPYKVNYDVMHSAGSAADLVFSLMVSKLTRIVGVSGMVGFNGVTGVGAFVGFSLVRLSDAAPTGGTAADTWPVPDDSGYTIQGVSDIRYRSDGALTVTGVTIGLPLLSWECPAFNGAAVTVNTSELLVPDRGRPIYVKPNEGFGLQLPVAVVNKMKGTLTFVLEEQV